MSARTVRMHTWVICANTRMHGRMELHGTVKLYYQYNKKGAIWGKLQVTIVEEDD